MVNFRWASHDHEQSSRLAPGAGLAAIIKWSNKNVARRTTGAAQLLPEAAADVYWKAAQST
jgi:hypothetical protein